VANTERTLLLVSLDEGDGFARDRVGDVLIDPAAALPPLMYPMRLIPLTIV
jgi:hypothetical protein